MANIKSGWLGLVWARWRAEERSVRPDYVTLARLQKLFAVEEGAYRAACDVKTAGYEGTAYCAKVDSFIPHSIEACAVDCQTCRWPKRG